jgi:hypothetical protein
MDKMVSLEILDKQVEVFTESLCLKKNLLGQVNWKSMLEEVREAKDKMVDKVDKVDLVKMQKTKKKFKTALMNF